ncbi:hypothetical protein Scep_019259 [Stephania cephalantha]|uniref:Uncharacterized protein n=1 Tax=Stephania cephalantha TaxID=152367 RepID=A0AAP0IAK9_9MAGN
MMIIVLIQCVQVIHTPQVIQHITSNIDNTWKSWCTLERITSYMTIHRQVEVLLSEKYKLHDYTICWYTCMVIHIPRQ